MIASRDNNNFSILKEIKCQTDERPTDSKDKNSMEHKAPVLTGADIALVLKDYEYNGGKPKSWYSWSSEMNQLYKFHKSLANKNGPLSDSELSTLDKLLQKKVKAKTAIAFGKLKEKRKPTLIFHTPPVYKQEYPFIKPTQHFKLVKKESAPKGSQTEMLEIMKKNPKKNLIRDNKNWVRVKVTPDERLRQFAINSAEMGNFAYGGPKYRINDSRLISEEIKDMISSSEYFTRDNGNNRYHPPENMARVMAHKWIYEEDDFHLNNSYVANGLFGSIDPERMFGSLTIPFTKIANYRCKGVKYDIKNNFHGKVEKVEITGDPISSLATDRSKIYLDRVEKDKKVYDAQKCSLLIKKPVNYMGRMTAEDYRTFPNIQHRVPMNWFTHDSELLTKASNKNETFRNEFNLQILKELVTKNLLVEFPRIHLEKKLSVSAKDFIKKNLADLLEIVKDEDEFQQFLAKKGCFAIRIILYEVRSFILRNKHYRALCEDDQWSKIVKTILDEFSYVKNLSKVSSLDVARRKKELENFSNALYKNSFDAIKQVKTSYRRLGSKIRSEKIQLSEVKKSESTKPDMLGDKPNKRFC